MNIMIRATNWVGDAIMALPAIRAVRQRHPDAQISIVARPYVADIYRDQQVCNELIPYDPKGEHRGWSGREKLVAELRVRKFDVALLLQNAFDAAWLAWRAQIPVRIGYARDARGLLLTKSIPVPKPGEIPPHEKFYYLELLRRSGWLDQLPDIAHIALQVPDAARHRAVQTLIEAGARPSALRIAVGAGASYGSAKCWPPDRFAKSLNALLSQHDADVILFGTPGEAPVSAAIACRTSALSNQSHRQNLHRRTPQPPLPMPSFPRQRFRSHARCRRRRPPHRRRVWPHRSRRHRARHPSRHHRPAKALLQPLLPPPLPHRPPLHDRHFPRHRRLRPPNPPPPGALCLTPPVGPAFRGGPLPLMHPPLT